MKTLPADLEALMPKPAFSPTKGILSGLHFFTADQVREAMLSATERAAKVCDSMSGSDYSPAQCATAIRGTK